MRNDVYTIYELACQKAERVSRDEKCTVHINAIVGMKDGKPDIITHRLSNPKDLP